MTTSWLGIVITVLSVGLLLYFFIKDARGSRGADADTGAAGIFGGSSHNDGCDGHADGGGGD